MFPRTVLDEAFPHITIDLVRSSFWSDKKKVMIYDVVQMLVEGEFNPQTVAALAHRLQIPTSLMFMCCPGPNFPYLVADFGTRIIIL